MIEKIWDYFNFFEKKIVYLLSQIVFNNKNYLY